MATIRLAACVAAILATASAVRAQDMPDPDAETPAISCDENDLSEDLRQVCDGIAESFDEVMSQPYVPTIGKRRAPLPSLVRRPVSSELTAFGLSATRDRLNPFATAPDRGVGVRVKAADVPVEFSSQMVQPGDPAGEIQMNWELKAERGATALQSGTFVGGAAAGTYLSSGGSENVSAFAGVRRVANPADNVRIGSEITPRVTVAEGASAASMTIEPKLTASSGFDRIGGTDLKGNLSADLGYNLPLVGEGSSYGAFRFTLTPR